MSEHLHVIAGPTASGKTALAIRLAKRLGAEIVNADSQQVYRHFDIGTAKPSAEELRQVPHHLISVIEPHDQFDAGRFQAMADEVILDLRRRHKAILVVGGTGLYLRALLHGVVVAPPRSDSLRQRLEARAAQEGFAALHAELARVDKVTAEKISPNDRVRIIRALELWELTGEPASKLREAHGFEQDRYPYSLYVLNPPKDALYRTIDERTRAMFEERGLVEEVRSLVEKGFESSAPMRSVGYAQALAVVKGELSLNEATADTAQKTRNYAKRQLTWFRREKGARFLAPPYGELEEIGATGSS